MTTDERLRQLLEDLDPAADVRAPDLLPLLDTDPTPRRRWLRPALLAAAAAAVLGLVGAAVVPQMLTTQTDSAQTTQEYAQADAANAQSRSGSAPTQDEPVYPGGPSIIRTASVLTSAENPQAAADEFVRAITGLGGRVLSQSVVTEGTEQTPMGTSGMDSMMPMPYPTGPGVWITVEVPAMKYEQAMAAAEGTGDVVHMEQTSEDVSTQVADVEARMDALRASVNRLQALMDRATSVSEVIAIEKAISNRQSELDGLVAQQRELLNSSRMSQISVTVMAPDDARAAVGEQADDPTVAWVAGLSVIAVVAIAAVLFLRRQRPQA